MTALTVYPDAHPEVTSVDGTVEEWYATSAGGKDWATIHDAAGNRSYTDGTLYTNRLLVGFQTVLVTYPNKWHGILRNILTFDVTGFPSNVSLAVLSLYGAMKQNDFTPPPTINIYSASPTSNNDLVAGDYDSLGTIPYSTPITYAGWSTTGYNLFTLNTTGLVALKAAIDGDGIFKIGVREATYDVADVEPSPWGYNDMSWFWYYSSEKGDGYKPELVVSITESIKLRVTGITRMVGPGTYLSRLALGGLPKVVTPAEFDKGLVSPATEEGAEMWYEITSEGIKFFWLFPDGKKEYITNL